jgi:hypothetical protein
VSAEANQRFDDLLIKTADLLVKRITNGEPYSIDLLGALLWWSAWFNVPLPAHAVGVLLVWDSHCRPPLVSYFLGRAGNVASSSAPSASLMCSGRHGAEHCGQ